MSPPLTATAPSRARVLAREIGHVEGRHSARALARSSLAAALSAALFGDFSAVAAGAPAVLMNMRNSREMETEADSYAIATLNQRGLSLAPLADLFEALGQLGSKDDDDNDSTSTATFRATRRRSPAARACAPPRPDWTGLCARPNRPQADSCAMLVVFQWRSLCLTKNAMNSACTRTMAAKARAPN
jgi:hypothetical protein